MRHRLTRITVGALVCVAVATPAFAYSDTYTDPIGDAPSGAPDLRATTRTLREGVAGHRLLTIGVASADGYLVIDHVWVFVARLDTRGDGRADYEMTYGSYDMSGSSCTFRRLGTREVVEADRWTSDGERAWCKIRAGELRITEAVRWRVRVSVAGYDRLADKVPNDGTWLT